MLKLHPDIATSYHNIGLAWSDKGEKDKALNSYQKCLEMQLKILEEDHPDLVTSYFNIGDTFSKINQFESAIENFKKAFEIEKKGSIPFEIAQCYEALNEKEKALTYYIQAAEIRKERIGLEDQATQESISNALRIAKELGKEGELPEWMI